MVQFPWNFVEISDLARTKRDSKKKHTLNKLMQVNDQKEDEEEILYLITSGKPIHERRDYGNDDGKVQVRPRRGARLALVNFIPHIDVKFVGCSSL